MQLNEEKKFFIFGGVIILMLVIIGLVAFFTQTIPNTFNIVFSSQYMIPSESSVFIFKPIEPYSKSGNKWIYAEDDFNYYYFNGAKDKPYLVFDKLKVSECEKFEIKNYKTWCGLN